MVGIMCVPFFNSVVVTGLESLTHIVQTYYHHFISQEMVVIVLQDICKFVMLGIFGKHNFQRIFLLGS